MKEKKERGVPLEDRFKGKGKRMCKLCSTSRGLIRKYKLYVCRRCFREVGEHIGFKKYGI